MQPFGEPLDQAGDADLVDHLGELPRARRAHEVAGARVGRDHFLGPRERGFIAAAHHREHAVFGAGLAAGNRGVDEIEAAPFRLGMKFARDCRRRGGVVDHDRGLPSACEYAVLAQHHLAQIVVIADAGKHEILARCRLFRRRRAVAAVLRHPLVRLGGGAVVDRDIVAALRFEMPRHRVAHHAKSDECDLCHWFPPLSRPGHDPTLLMARPAARRQRGSAAPRA